MIIDFHSHCFPDKLAPRAINSLEKSSGGTSFLNGTITDLKQSMEEAKIKLCVLLPIAVRPEQTVTINTVAIENNQKEGFLSFGSVHPEYFDWKNELKRIKDAGVKGIKLHPDFQGVFLDDSKMAAVMEEAAALGLLITIHAGMDVSYPDLHRSTPKRLANILPQLKGAKIICAHSGGFRYTDEFLNTLLGKEEIYIDTSYSIGKMNTTKLRQLYGIIQPDHILFGTDSPWDCQKKAVSALKALQLPQELEEKIFYKNAEKLLGIQ